MIVVRLPRRWRRSAGRRRRRRGRTSRRRTLLLLCVPPLVAGAALLVWLDVAVTSRFDGRLWLLPATVYSDVLEIERGDRLPVELLASRLERSGYAAGQTAPDRAGRFRRADDRLDVYLRAFDTPAGSGPSEAVSIRFRGERIVGIVGADGVRRRRVLLEPERLATIHGGRLEERVPLPLDEIPPRLVAAVLAAEDARFREHHGIDPRGVLRAAFANAKAGRIVQGGSTITQQTVKNLFLEQRRTWWRKLRELPMAVILDARYSKDRILEVYLNEVYLGQRGPAAICGVQAAARFYFGRDVADLDTGEAALLAGLVSSPGRFNPFRHPESALARRNAVLDAMVRLGTLDAEAAGVLRDEPLRLGSGAGGFSGAPWFVDHVRATLAREVDARRLREDGLEIFTTLDTRLQLHATAALQEGLARLERDRPGLRRDGGEPLEGAMVVLRPSDGAVVALVGGRDHARTQFNRATQATRQPGSCFKPFVYAAGFEAAERREPGALTPATLLDDSPLELRSGGETWAPSNYDREFRGPVTVRQAFEESLNVPTVRAAQEVGLERIVELARRAGIRSPLEPLPSLALGAEEVVPLELAEAYGTFASGGVHRQAWAVGAVVGPDGELIDAVASPPEGTRVLSRETAYLVDGLLRGVVRRGTARSAAALGYAGGGGGKTGTTDDTRDAWFVGYEGDLLALVWVGFDDNDRTGLTGATGALPIWVDFMDRLQRREPAAMRAPEGLIAVLIDPTTGALAVPGCPEVRRERFVPGTEPTERCREHESRLRRWWRRLTGSKPDDGTI